MKKENKKLESIRVYPLAKKKIVKKFGSLQKFIDQMIQEILKEK